MKEKTVTRTNPPPRDVQCDVCGKHASELSPFGGPGDPLVGDFNGALLVKHWRRAFPLLSTEELATYRREYGNEAADFYECGMRQVGSSWDCRYCILLDDRAALELIRKRWQNGAAET